MNTTNEFQQLGIPKDKSNLFDYKNLYHLKLNHNNFFIIFHYDKFVIKLTNKYRVRIINEEEYLERLENHIRRYYGLNYGKQLKNRVIKAIKGS